MLETTARRGLPIRRLHRGWGWVAACCILVLTLGACSDDSDTSDGQYRDFFVFVTADPQINIPKWGLHGLSDMVAVMNETPGTDWPFGGTVETPKGVLVPGDLVDETSNPDNWQAYTDFFDPQGNAQLRFPVYAGVGNHDLEDNDRPFSDVERAVIERNKRRPGPLHLDQNGYNYSWDWQGIHFVNLNLFPGNEPRPVYGNPSPWNDPHNSLSFLRSDLQQRVGDSGRPVILMWHYGLRGWGLEKWWTEEDLTALKSVLADYNVVLILHGHEHRYERYEWAGYDVVMAPAPYSPKQADSTGVQSIPKGFLMLRLTQDSLQLAHHDAAEWKETWTKPLGVGHTPEKEAPALDSVTRDR